MGIDPIEELTFIALIALIQIFFLYKLIRYKKNLDQKNIQLIQFYLDTKFICKGLIDSLKISDSSEFCNNLIHEIKDYYNLEDILIIDSLKMIDGENNTRARNIIIEYAKNHLEELQEELDNHKLAKTTIRNNDSNYVVYLSKLHVEDEGDGIIACIEQYPTLLSENERASLETNINLLKTRLFYE